MQSAVCLPVTTISHMRQSVHAISALWLASTVGSGSENAATKKKQWKGYTREYKLEVVKFKERNGPANTTI